MQIEQNGHRMHEYHAQDAIREMPQISHPDVLGIAAINHLPKEETIQSVC